MRRKDGRAEAALWRERVVHLASTQNSSNPQMLSCNSSYDATTRVNVRHTGGCQRAKECAAAGAAAPGQPRCPARMPGTAPACAGGPHLPAAGVPPAGVPWLASAPARWAGQLPGRLVALRLPQRPRGAGRGRQGYTGWGWWPLGCLQQPQGCLRSQHTQLPCRRTVPVCEQQQLQGSAAALVMPAGHGVGCSKQRLLRLAPCPHKPGPQPHAAASGPLHRPLLNKATALWGDVPAGLPGPAVPGIHPFFAGGCLSTHQTPAGTIEATSEQPCEQAP